MWGDKARAKAASKSGENAGSSRAPWEKTPTERRDKPVPAQSKPYAGKSENARPARAGARPAPAPARAAAASGRGKPAEAAPPPPAPPAPHIDGKQERIAKLLARAGVASRREIERMIEDRRIALDGVVLETPATILTSLRGVTVDGQPVAAPERTRLFRFHKPSGLLTAERDPAGRPTIYTALRNALPQGAPRLMPIGRLDLNTEGLLLMTNDGELKRLLELPATGVPRTYRARTFGDISQAQLEELIHGITIEGVHYGRIDANLERRTGRNQWIELTLTEGKNREVRRVLEHLGLAVSRLMRTYYGPFMLEDLPRGAAVEVHPEDVARFRNSLRPPRSRAGDTTAKNDTNDKEA
ncbi:pseudouridine synthase [Croceibacterium xixiisoli]|uniref:pseudouridine synthase n=1 Tax=Croceibacterium xixiisoli TaxID=1476466 RepID=UPI002E274B72